MPALSDYLGALLAEITNARLQADLESARIAQLYASHPLLQHMPVPRFRLPNVSLELPVAVEKIEQQPAAPLRPAELDGVKSKIMGIVEQESTQRQIQLAPNLLRRLNDRLGRSLETLKASKGITASDAIRISTDAANVAAAAIYTAGKDHTTADPVLEPSLRRRFAAEFLKLQPASARVQVTVVTAQLKEIAPSQSLTRINLTISEEGVEWTQTNPSDASSKTLLPE